MLSKISFALIPALGSFICLGNVAEAQISITQGGCGNPSAPCLGFINMPTGAGELPPDLAQRIFFTGDASVKTFSGSLLNTTQGVFLGSVVPGQQLYNHLKLTFNFASTTSIRSEVGLLTSGFVIGNKTLASYDAAFSRSESQYSVDLDTSNLAAPIGALANDGKTTSIVPVYGVLTLGAGDFNNPDYKSNRDSLLNSTVTVQGFFNSTAGTVPEPGSVAMLGTMFIGGGLTFWRYRRRK